VDDATDKKAPVPGKWFSRNVLGFSLTSLFGDFCHEMATAVLPQFMQAIGASAAALGFIEGAADAVSSFAKLGAGYHSDKIGHRKAWTVVGYVLTAICMPVLAFAFAWPLILAARVVGWLGRGIRGPLRDAMLAESIAPQDRGKAFGFERAGDTAGAVIGPLTAFALLTWASAHPAIAQRVNSWLPGDAAAHGGAFRIIFLLSLIPGILSVLSVAFLTTEKRRPRDHEMRFMSTLRAMPREYRRFLLAVGLFGIADFAPTLMILRASTVLAPSIGLLDASRYAALLYLLRNVVYALAAYPIGALSDRFSRTRYLAVGYAVAVVTFIGFAIALPSLWWLIACFILAGVFIAWEDTCERAAVRDYVHESIAGTAFGVLGTVNGVGDFASSLIVGAVWTTIGAPWGFAYAILVGAAGTLLMALTKRPANLPQGGAART
jgi:MFS family permease